MPKLEYQFEIETRKGTKPEKVIIMTERMPYDSALDLSDKLGRKGIHYHIKEIYLRDNFQRRISSKMLRMPVRKRYSLIE